MHHSDIGQVVDNPILREKMRRKCYMHLKELNRTKTSATVELFPRKLWHMVP